MHKDTVHRGKIREKAMARLSPILHLDRVENDLKKAMSSENYEEAARYRDLIAQAREGLNVS